MNSKKIEEMDPEKKKHFENANALILENMELKSLLNEILDEFVFQRKDVEKRVKTILRKYKR